MLKRTITPHLLFPLLAAFGCMLFGGCSSGPPLMPTPNLYTHPQFNLFADVPPALQSNKVEILYVTDRLPQKGRDGNEPSTDNIVYGHERSRSAAFGVAEFQIGDDNLSWDELVKESTLAKRDKKLEISVPATRELGRFAPTPPSLVIFQSPPSPDAQQAARQAESAQEKKFIEQLTAQLSRKLSAAGGTSDSPDNGNAVGGARRTS